MRSLAHPSPVPAVTFPSGADRHAALAAAGVWIVIPSFRVREKIGVVLAALPDWVAGVVVIDDVCPEGTGQFVEQSVADPRVRVARHVTNQGVGGAVLTGYAEALAAGAEIIVKVDGDDQMDLALLPTLVLPIMAGEADYTKGHRFAHGSHLEGMPATRVIGNAALSLMAKVSTGYWNIFDPTNGYTAIDARVAREILSKKVERRYFFESDMLYHLGTLRAVVRDVPMPARYADEKSNLNISRVVGPFLYSHMRNTLRRFVGQYIVRDFSVATLEFLLGAILFLWGVTAGAVWMIWKTSPTAAASAGTVMGVALPIILGFQLLLAGLNFDVLNVPRDPIGPPLRRLDEYLNAPGKRA